MCGMRIFVWLCAHMCTGMSTCVCKRERVIWAVYICIHVTMHAYVQVGMHAHVYVCERVLYMWSLCVCVNVAVCVNTCV